jgi:hypothetical protein
MSRLFHAIVVMGAGVSVSSCGGQVAGAGDGDASAGGGGRGANGTPGGGGSSGTFMGTGGLGGAGGVTPPVVDAGVAPDAAMELATVAQWDCTNNACATHAFENGFINTLNITSPCAVDLARPRTAADCADGEWFQCTLAYLDDQPIEVNCLCTPPSPTCDLCAPQGPRPGAFASSPFRCGAHTKLCSCPAYTGILIR